MDQTGNGTDGLIGRAERIALLVKELSDDRWITDVISRLRQSDPKPSESLMVELTLSELERSAQKLLDLRENLLNEAGKIARDR
jgi:hypothetical protein